MDAEAKNHFNDVLGSLNINLNRSRGMMPGVVDNPEAYNLYQGLIDLTRGVYKALDGIEDRLIRLEREIKQQK